MAAALHKHQCLDLVKLKSEEKKKVIAILVYENNQIKTQKLL